MRFTDEVMQGVGSRICQNKFKTLIIPLLAIQTLNSMYYLEMKISWLSFFMSYMKKLKRIACFDKTKQAMWFLHSTKARVHDAFIRLLIYFFKC